MYRGNAAIRLHWLGSDIELLELLGISRGCVDSALKSFRDLSGSNPSQNLVKNTK